MIFLRTPQPASVLPRTLSSDRETRFQSDIDLLPTRIGTFAIQRATGTWAYLDEREAEALRALADTGGATARDMVGRWALTQGDLEHYLACLWDRSLVTANGGWATEPAARWENIAQQSRHVFSLALILSSGCNLGCHYCYLGRETSAPVERLATVEALRAVDWAFSRDAPLTVFDLGEITMAGSLWQELIEEIRARADRLGRPIRVMIQTNGTTLDAPAIACILRHGVSVGISLDGPALVHDAARPFRRGRGGTHTRVVQTLTEMRRARVPHWAVATIGRHNLSDPEGLIDYLASMELPDFVLKPVLPYGLARGAWAEVGVQPDEYAGFLRLAIRRSLQHSPDRLDLTTRQFLWRALGSPHGWMKSCTSRLCGCGESRLVLEADGRWTPCPRFGEFAGPPGGPPPDGITGPRLALPAWSRTIPARCRPCAWLTHCGGGCALSGRDDPHCPSYQAAFAAIFEDVVPELIAKSVTASASLGAIETIASTWESRRALRRDTGAPDSREDGVDARTRH